MLCLKTIYGSMDGMIEMSTELSFAIATLVCMAFVVGAYALGRIYLIALTAALLVLSNVIGPKIVSVFGFAITAGTPIFSALPLATDLLAERYGSRSARLAVFSAFVAMMLFVGLTWPIASMEALPFAAEAGAAVDTVMNQSLRLMLASPIAYFIWQLIDIWIFGNLKKAFQGRKLWLRNNVSTIVAQAGSTLTFFGLAFGGTDVPWIEIAIVTIVFYWIIALFVDTPFIYATRYLFRSPRNN